ncbi:MAG: AMP-binding protein [Sandaracinaceae bacterium]|nr:AMP-binding protein [Sandaracinaceae bacterium]
MNPFSERMRRVFRTHAARVAVLDRGRACTYAELDQRVQRVAALLHEARVGPGVLVGLDGSRALARVVDLLALMRVGAVPLLLCPRWPQAYRRACIITSLASHTLTAGVLARVEGAASCEPLPSDAAYLIYTSGSSGRPKGVVGTHAGLVPVLDAQIEAFALSPASRSLFLLGLAFDASLSDIGTALLAGATLVLEDDASCAPSRLLATAAQRGVTYADIPPAYLAHLDADALPACLTTLVVGGEVAPPQEVRRLAERVTLFNVYGPTEATICTSLGRCDAAWSRPLLGQPIAGNTYEVVSREGLPAGEGELLIAGPGLALGYHLDDELTAQRFVARAGRRWYRTGDVVRRHPDGEWEFRGRVDRQRKLRGQLVAPEQVEAALLRTGAVRAASVSLSGDGQRLLAQVEPCVAVSRGERAAWGAQLRETLRQQLPAGLVPDEVRLTHELPRGATGKLVHIHAASSLHGAVVLEPPGAVLGRDALAPDEDFFDAGGTSLLALEVAARAEAAGSRVSAVSIAQGRTPRAALASHTAELTTWLARAAQERWLGSVTPLSRTPARPLSAMQVLVTGATGTLGGALLPRLLDELGPDGRVHCLVRRPDALHAGLPPALRVAAGDPRVRVHVGDVTEEHLGLAAAHYAQLTEQLHTVIHLAARLSAAASLHELNAVNLEGTRRVLQLCASGRPKALLHASTLSVFTDALPRPERCMEADDLAITEALLTPYATSKWLAERLVRSADPHAHATTIVRLGLLTSTAADGHGAPHGHLARFLRGLARVGALPAPCVSAATELQLDITPLDHAADACLALLRHDRAAGVGGTYHVAATRPATLAALMLAMHAEGIPLRTLPSQEFFTLAGEQRDPSGDAALMALSLGRGVPGMLASHRALDLFAATGAHFSLVNTTQALAASSSSLHTLQPDHALLRRYVRAALA